MNSKKCNPVYLNYGDKAAFFHMDREKESRWYRIIWENYYRLYSEKWVENHNKPTSSIV